MTSNPWVEHFASRPHPRLRLFCFPYAGGGAAVFRQWPHFLPEAAEVCPVEIPGRGRRFGEPLFRRVGPLVSELVQNLEPFLDLPFAFFGHSMGGLLAFELAREFRRRGMRGPEVLFVSASEPPHQLKKREKILHQLPDEEFMRELERLGGTPPEVLRHRELIQLFLPVVRADLEMLETYRYEKEDPLSLPLVVFGGEEDQEVPCEDLGAWKEQTLKTFSLHRLQGDHFFLKNAGPAFWKILSEELQGMSLESR